MRFSFSKKEIVHLALSIALLTVMLSFNSAFSAAALVRLLLIITISLLTAAFFQKLIGLKYNHEVEYRIWALKEYIRSHKTVKNQIKNIFYNYTGLIIPPLLFIMTNGLWAFLAIASFTIVSPLKTKIGRISTFLEEKEVAAISFFGILTYVFIALILDIITGYTNLIETKIPLLLALYALIPIPNLPGARLFFGRRITYFFLLSLTISLFILLPIIAMPDSLIISIIFSLIIIGLYFYAIESGIKQPFSVEETSVNIGWKLLFIIVTIAIIFLLLTFSQVKMITILALSIIIATLIILLHYYLIQTKK